MPRRTGRTVLALRRDLSKILQCALLPSLSTVFLLSISLTLKSLKIYFFTFIVSSRHLTPRPAILAIRLGFTALAGSLFASSVVAVSFLPCSIPLPLLRFLGNGSRFPFRAQQLARVHVRAIRPMGMQFHRCTGIFNVGKIMRNVVSASRRKG